MARKTTKPPEPYGPWAERFATFNRTWLRHTTGQWAGQPIVFEPWQMEVWTDVLDTVDYHTGLRLYREYYLELPKKNSKSTMASCFTAYALVDEGRREPGCEIYAAANSKEQARVVFGETEAFLKASPLGRGERHLHFAKDAIECKETGAVFRAISADGFVNAGWKPHIVVIDEIFAFEGKKALELYDQMRNAFGNRAQALLFAITTAGFTFESLAGSLHTTVKKNEAAVKKGKPPVDPRLGGRIYGLTPKQAKSPKNLKKANPASWIREEELLAEYKSAKAKGRVSSFLRLRASVWSRTEEMMLAPGAWDKCKTKNKDGKVDIQPGDAVYSGVDIGLKSDSTGRVLACKKDGKILLRAENWAVHADPEQPAPLAHNVLEADEVDLADVKQAITEDAQTYQLAEVDYDNWAFFAVAQELEKDGIEMVKFSQGGDRMVAATELFIRLVMEGIIEHEDDEVFESHIGAAVVRHTRAGRRLDKTKARDHQDLVTAGAMAVFRAYQEESGGFKLRFAADYV